MNRDQYLQNQIDLIESQWEEIKLLLADDIQNGFPAEDRYVQYKTMRACAAALPTLRNSVGKSCDEMERHLFRLIGGLDHTDLGSAAQATKVFLIQTLSSAMDYDD